KYAVLRQRDQRPLNCSLIDSSHFWRLRRVGPVSVKSAKVAGREEIRVLMAVRPPQCNRMTPESSPEIRPFGQADGMLTSGRGQLSSSRNSGVKRVEPGLTYTGAMQVLEASRRSRPACLHRVGTTAFTITGYPCRESPAR